ncbi:unnamed protein product [Effrenium voratum]|nr:unnamed protein product [Effrenium voratum]
MSLFPDGAIAMRWTSLNEVLTWYNIDQGVWLAFVGRVGDPGDSVRLMAALPETALEGVNHAEFSDGTPLSMIQAAHVGLVWRCCRRMAFTSGGGAWDDWRDTDPWQPLQATMVAGSSQGVSGGGGSLSTPTGSGTATGNHNVKERTVKMSAVIDQSDEGEFIPVTMDMYDSWVQRYLTIMGFNPQDEEDPTLEQLTALFKKVTVQENPPFVDFAVWVPFGRRALRANKFRTWLPSGDGTYIAKELPGPGNFQQWLASWRVFRVASLMLGILSLAVLEGYERHVEKLVRMYPTAWHLIVAADEKARSEKLIKIKQKVLVDASNGKRPPDGWEPKSPWTACFRLLLEDEGFWAHHVRHPATAWMAAGGRGVAKTPVEEFTQMHAPGGEGSWEMPTVVNDPKKRQANRDRRAAKKKRLGEERDEGNRGKGNAGKAPKGGGKGGVMAELEGTVAIGEGFEVRLQAAREEARSMREYVEMRPFKFLHHFAGETDGLAEELMTMAQEVYMRVSMVSVDRLGGTDLLAEEPYTTHLRGMLLGEYDAYHSGHKLAGSVWDLPEMKEFLLEEGITVAGFNSCRYMQDEEMRFFKPQVFAGRLDNLKELSGGCLCGVGFQHTPVVGKEMSLRAGAYPRELCRKCAGLVLASWMRTAKKEWLTFRGMELVQEIKGTSAKIKPAPPTSRSPELAAGSQELLDLDLKSAQEVVEIKKRKKHFAELRWQGGSGRHQQLKAAAEHSKKARRELENREAIGGMRNPATAVRRLPALRSVGEKVADMFDSFVSAYPDALKVATEYGSGDAVGDPGMVEVWRDWLVKFFNTQIMQDEDFEEGLGTKFKSPLQANLLEAWAYRGADPEAYTGQWVRQGAPLGMSVEIPTCGIFPLVKEDDQMKITPWRSLEPEAWAALKNYPSMVEHEDAAAEEVDRLIKKGYACRISKGEAGTWQSGTMSKLSILLKEKPNGEVKKRLIIDLLRSGGNDKCVPPGENSASSS